MVPKVIKVVEECVTSTRQKKGNVIFKSIYKEHCNSASTVERPAASSKSIFSLVEAIPEDEESHTVKIDEDF